MKTQNSKPQKRVTRLLAPLVSATLIFSLSIVPCKKANAAIVFYANGNDQMAYAFLISGLVLSAASGYGLILLTLDSSPKEQVGSIAQYISQQVPQLDRETSFELAEKILNKFKKGQRTLKVEKNQKAYQVRLNRAELLEILEKSQVELNPVQFQKLQETVL